MNISEKKQLKINWDDLNFKKLIILLIIVPIIIFIKDFIIFNCDMSLNQEQIFYFYSSAAQAIATFIAFLIAGYAFVYQVMDNLEKDDDELKDIHYQLKKEYHYELTSLSISTGFAVILSLIVVWSNAYLIPTCFFPIKSILIAITDIFIILTIILAILFVIKIIDPDKYTKTAKIVRDEKYGPINEKGDIGVFMENFIELESSIRALLINHDIPAQERHWGMRRMIDELLRNEIISFKIHESLLYINNYRNLVVHGHLKDVDQDMVDLVIKLNDKIDKLNSN